MLDEGAFPHVLDGAAVSLAIKPGLLQAYPHV